MIISNLSYLIYYKNHNIQHSLLKMLEKFKEALDKGSSVSAIFMDLSCLVP